MRKDETDLLQSRLQSYHLGIEMLFGLDAYFLNWILQSYHLGIEIYKDTIQPNQNPYSNRTI